MKYIRPIAIVLTLSAYVPPVAAESIAVPLWQPHDFAFKAPETDANPYQVEIDATVTGPGGKSFTLPGFFDGDGTWKIRFSPTAEGDWTLTTKSDVPALDAQTASFTCVKSDAPGVLRVDKDHPHHFVFDDGTRFFLQAYEYDWLWALDMGDPDVPTVKKTLDLIGAHGFNYVLLNAYAHDTKWRMGKTDPDDYGPPDMYPFAGTNDEPDHSRLNVAFWQHYDRVMDAMLDRGIQAHIFIKVYNKDVNWPEKGSPEEKGFFRWLIARYAAYPNVIWDFAKEAHKDKDLAYKQGLLKYIRATDPYGRLLTVHDDDIVNDKGAYDELTDFRTDQHHEKQGGPTNREIILAQRERRAWPVANFESDYECGPEGLKDKTYNKAMTPEATAKTLWDIAMAGAYIGYYYTYTAWDVIRPLDEPKGYTYMKHFGEFWRSTEYWKLEPSDNLAEDALCIAQPGKEYIVFQKEAQPFTVEITGTPSPLKGEWFNPFTGERTPAGDFPNGKSSRKPPEGWGDAPLVLHIHGN